MLPLVSYSILFLFDVVMQETDESIILKDLMKEIKLVYSLVEIHAV